MLMPEVVNQMAALEAAPKTKKAGPKNWSVSADMFPCQLSPDTLSKAKEASLLLVHKEAVPIGTACSDACSNNCFLVVLAGQALL